MAEAIRTVLVEALEQDEAVVLLGETVGRMGGVAGETAGLMDRFGSRVRDVPIADRGTIGLAVGMAIGGKRPIVQLAGPARLPNVLEALADAGAISKRGEFTVPLVVRVPYGAEAIGEQPATALLGGVAGVRVVCPTDAGMASGLLRFALSDQGPTLLLEPRAAMLRRGTLSTGAVEPRARTIRAGQHVTVAAWGEGVGAALQAAEALSQEGMSVEVIDLVSLSPLDAAFLGERVRATGRLVVVHQGDPEWAQRVRQCGLDEAFLYLEAPMGEAPARADLVTAAARSAVTY